MADTMIFNKTALTGGGSGSLDVIDGNDRGDGEPLQEGDAAFVTYGGNFYFYLLDEDIGGAENAPALIVPDTNAGDKRWVQQSIPAVGYLAIADIDDTPVNNELDAPISSNWAYEHAADPDAHGAAYVLPTASPATLGGIKVGTRLSIDAGGVVSADDQAIDLASPDAIGGTTPNTIQGYNKEIFKTASADSPLTAAQCAGTIVSNYGMTDADCEIYLPAAAEGLSFVCVLPVVRARYFRLRCPSAQSDKINLLTEGAWVAGSDDGYVGVASGYAANDMISMICIKVADGGYEWFAMPITGTWVAG
jgi:hypothetical protein